MQFGAVIHYAIGPIKFMLFKRLCIPVPFAGGSLYDIWDEKIVQFNKGEGNYLQSFSSLCTNVTTVPIIVLYTKLDLLMARARMNKSGMGQSDSMQESAEKNFRDKQGPEFEQLARSEERRISYTVVGCTFQIETIHLC